MADSRINPGCLVGHDSYQENGTSHPSTSADENMHVDVNDPIYQVST